MQSTGDKWNHGWGFRDTEFEIGPDGHVRLTGTRYEISGFSMPGFLPFCEDALGVKLKRDDLMQTVAIEVPAPNKNDPFCAAVAAAFPAEDYSFDGPERAIHSHGQATGDEVYPALYGKLARFVDMVFYCRSEASAARITELALEHNVCLVPFGGGTNVSGCLTLPTTETRMIVSVDTKFLNKIEWVNQANGQACVQAGITGSELEAQLRRHGFTCGHEPDSIELSTLGGWISTNASGMKRHRYGGIEEIVEHVTVVTPTGQLETLDMFPRQSTGVQIRPSLFGSEGNFGLITKAVLRLRRLPETTAYQSLIFPTFERGVGFLHALSGTSFIPASIRLVDNAQFRFGHALKPAEDNPVAAAKSKLQRMFLEKVKGVDLSRMCVATIVMEGLAPEVEAQEKLIQQLAAQHQGFFAGSGNGKRGYNLTFAIAYIRDFLTRLHVMGETVETTAPWDKIQAICAAVRTEANRIHSEFGLPGKPFVSHRVTQLYTTGVCIYFTYGIYTRGVKDEAHVATVADARLRGAIIDAGGAISNHHGIGKFRSQFLKARLPASNERLIRAMKETIDPTNVFGIQNGVFHDAAFKRS